MLVSMPFGALDRPALGLSLLKAAAAKVGIDCELRYFNMEFAAAIGADDYRWLVEDLPYTAFAGDWCFTLPLYGHRPQQEAAYEAEILAKLWQMDRAAIDRIGRIRRRTPDFLDYCLTAVDWQRYDVVGFTSTFEQNLASLALAGRLKQANPDLLTVFGGANWEGEIGETLHQCFDFVDIVCSGEADDTFPLLLTHLAAHGSGVPKRPGYVYRDAQGRTVSTGQAALITQMDELSAPDFTDYFDCLSRNAAMSDVLPHLLMETSRGCWWGAKSHCTFCGLNGSAMHFRSKSAHRAFGELKALAEKWQVEFIEVVDNILDMRYFDSFLPLLIEAGAPVSLYYETKSNLKRHHLALLAAAGVRSVQPGIESLSDAVLRLMRKGTTALRNIQMLKWAQEYDISVDWNILYGFPGEKAADYRQMLDLLPAIRHLQPPSACGPVRLDRFSPYFNNPQSFGLRRLRSLAPYKYLYPFDEALLRRIAYYFDFEYEDSVAPGNVADAVIAYIDDWSKADETGRLRCRDDGQSLQIADRRSIACRPHYQLTGLERAAYLLCDSVQTRDHIAKTLAGLFPRSPFQRTDLENFLEDMVAHRLMVRDEKCFLSLALHQAYPENWQERYATASTGAKAMAG